MMEKLMSILKELRPEVDFEKEKSLIDGGILDSFDLVSLIGELNESFGIEISYDDMYPDNFNSAGQIYEMIVRLQGGE